MDLLKPLHQISINNADIHKTTLHTSFGLYKSTCMQFDSCNASSIHQKLIDELIWNLPGPYVSVDGI